MKNFALSLLLASAPLLSAQVAPGPQPQQPGSSSQAQPSGDPSSMPGSPAQTQPNDPNAMPAAPPAFAPGVGADNANVTAKPRLVRISSRVMEGLVLTKVDPVYPQAARAAGLSGSVVLDARISKDGHVENLAAMSGPSLLQAAAVDAVKHWTYRPYLLNGQPVEVQTAVTVYFHPN